MRFRRWVVFAFAIHVLVVLIDKGAGLVLYKLLEDSPKVKGAVDLLAVLPFIMMAVANLGLATSGVYFLRKGAFGLRQVAETSSLVALVWGTAIALLAIVVSQTVLPLIRPNWNFDLRYVVPVCLCVPFLLTASYFNSIQLAIERVRDYGLVHLFSSAIYLPLFLVFFVTLGDAVDGIAVGRLAAAVLVAAFTLWMLRGLVRWRPRMHWVFFKAAVGYGWKANLTSLLTYLNHRLDLFLVGFLYTAAGAVLSPDELRDAALAQAAFYSLAVSFAELVWHFPEAMRDLIFSKVAGSTHDEARRFTPILCRLSLWGAAAGSLAVFVLADPLMTLISPQKWDALWEANVMASLAVLIPGTVAFTIAKTLQNDLAARGHLNDCLVACGVVLVTMIALDVLLIPAFGAVGAGIASTVGYGASSLYTLFAYRARGGAGIAACLIVRPQDWDYVRELFVAVRDKIRRRPA